MALRNRRLAALALFVTLSVLHTWPLATDPGALTRYDNADAQLNTWILAWVPHALVTQPLHLFDANIFHPERLTLAYSENLIVPALMGAPLIWAGVSPVLVHNLLLMAGMALTGWAMCLVLQAWTDDWFAAIVGGSLLAFNAHTLTRLAHVQAMHAAFLPAALLALDLLMTRPSARHGVRLAIAFTLQALCSMYLLVFTAVALVVSTVARTGEWLRPPRLAPFLRHALLAAVLAVVACAPVLVPYARVRTEQGLVRSLDEVALYNAWPGDYLATGARLHFGAWSHRFYRATDSLFPGITASLLAILAVGAGLAWRDPRARMLAATGLAGAVLSFGTFVPGYAWLHTHVPLLEGLRGTSRFGFLALFGIAGLAAFGVAWLRTCWRGAGARRAVGIAALVLVHAEAARFPLDYTRFEGIPRVYDVLRDEPGAVVAEFPFGNEEHVIGNARYVLASTRHWRPLLNGYSGFTPPSYAQHARAFAGFPGGPALQALRDAGVTHVVVHADRAPDIATAAAARPELQSVASSREIRIYRLR